MRRSTPTPVDTDVPDIDTDVLLDTDVPLDTDIDIDDDLAFFRDVIWAPILRDRRRLPTRRQRRRPRPRPT